MRSPLPAFRRLFRFPSRTARDIETDVNEEIRFHLDMRAEDLVAQGLTLDEARREARRQFGDLRATTRSLYAMDRGRERTLRVRTHLEEIRQDVRHAWRGLRRQWALSSVALATIALGIAAATAVFSVVHAVLLRPLPFHEVDRLVVTRVSVPDYQDLRLAARTFESSAIWASNLYNVGPRTATEQVLGCVVSRELLPLLGVSPLIGRTFDARDADAPIVVLGYGFWKQRLGGDPSVIGRTVALSGTAHTIIGVMPPGFAFPSRDYQLWVGMDAAMRVAPEQTVNRGLRLFRSLVRLRPSVALSQAQAEADTIAARLARQFPDTNAGIRFELTPLFEHQVGDVRPALLVVLATVGCLLLLACANVASLLLARMTTRAHEIAVRAALGAGRSRLVRQFLTESLVLAVAGGVLGLLLAAGAVAVAPALLEAHVPRAHEIRLDLAMFTFSMAATLVTGVLVGLAPAVQGSSSAPAMALSDMTRSATETPRGGRLRAGLVVVQVGIAVLVLSAAGLLARSLERLLDVQTGFRQEGVLTFNVPLFQLGDAVHRTQAVERLTAALQLVPGIEAAGGASALPPVTAQRATRFEVAGGPELDPAHRSAYFVATTPGYFRALDTPLLEGRFFTTDDSERAGLVVILSRSLARRLFPGRSPIGRLLRLVNPEHSREWRTIVGVVADVRYEGLADDFHDAIYTPFAQTPFLWLYGMVRVAGDPAMIAPLVRDAVARSSPELTLAGVRPMASLVSDSVADPRFRTILLGSFAGLALLLSAVGLYGAVSYSVTRRRREMGIRLALGARPSLLLTQTLIQGVALTVPGVVIGVCGSQFAGRFIASLLYQVRPSDPLTIGGVSMVLVGVGLVASLVPALRAARVDPVVALRVE